MKFFVFSQFFSTQKKKCYGHETLTLDGAFFVFTDCNAARGKKDETYDCPTIVTNTVEGVREGDGETVKARGSEERWR